MQLSFQQTILNKRAEKPLRVVTLLRGCDVATSDAIKQTQTNTNKTMEPFQMSQHQSSIRSLNEAHYRFWGTQAPLKGQWL